MKSVLRVFCFVLCVQNAVGTMVSKDRHLTPHLLGGIRAQTQPRPRASRATVWCPPGCSPTSVVALGPSVHTVADSCQGGLGTQAEGSGLGITVGV